MIAVLGDRPMVLGTSNLQRRQLQNRYAAVPQAFFAGVAAASSPTAAFSSIGQRPVSPM
jgi:hypothetical protein